MSCIYPSNAGFIETPSPTNAFLDTTAQFMCTVQGGLIQWHIDGIELSNIPPERKISSTTTGEKGIRTSSLSILASVRNNNSDVQCTISNGTTEVMRSPTVELKVQGMPFNDIW